MFFHWKAIYKNSHEDLHKSTENHWNFFLECQSRMSITFKCIFSGEDRLTFFWQKGNIIFVTIIHIYRKYQISMYFLRKIIFHFQSKEKISYFRVKQIPSFQIIQERSYSSAIFLERPSFQNIWRKYRICMYFLRSMFFHFLSKEKISYFRVKKLSSFQIIQERSYSSVIFFGKTIFWEHLKKISYFHVFFLRKIIFHFLSKE